MLTRLASRSARRVHTLLASLAVTLLGCDSFRVSVCDDEPRFPGCMANAGVMQVAPPRLHLGANNDDSILSIHFIDQEALRLLLQGTLPQVAIRQGGNPPITLTKVQRAADDVLVSIPKAILQRIAYGPFDILATINGRQLRATLRLYQNLAWSTPMAPKSSLLPNGKVHAIAPARGSIAHGTIFHSYYNSLTSSMRWYFTKCSLILNSTDVSVSSGTYDFPPFTYGTESSQDCDSAVTANGSFARCRLSSGVKLLRIITPNPDNSAPNPMPVQVYPLLTPPDTPLTWDQGQLVSDPTSNVVILQDGNCLRYFNSNSGNVTAAAGADCLGADPQNSTLAIGDLDDSVGSEVVLITQLPSGITATVLSRNSGVTFVQNTELSAGLTKSLRDWLTTHPDSALSRLGLKMDLNDFDRDGLPDLMMVGVQGDSLALVRASYIGNNEFEIIEDKIQKFFPLTGTIKSIASGTIQNNTKSNIDLVVNATVDANTPYVRVLPGNGL